MDKIHSLEPRGLWLSMYSGAVSRRALPVLTVRNQVLLSRAASTASASVHVWSKVWVRNDCGPWDFMHMMSDASIEP